MFDESGLSWIGHSLSLTALLGAATGLFTPLAAAATFLWFAVQVYESKTVRGYIHRRRERRLSRLKLRLDELEKLLLEE